MTRTRAETLPLTDGSYLRLTVAEPDNVVRGGVVVLHESRGVTDGVRQLTAALADEGYLTVAPHLYRGPLGGLSEDTGEIDTSAGDVDVREHVATLDGESVLADTDAAFVWLTDHGVPTDRLAVLGYDLGGTAALVVAASRSLGAAVSVDGGGIVTPLSDGFPSLLEIAGEISCPWLGLYAELESGPDADEVDKLRDVAGDAEVVTDVVRCRSEGDAEHRFDITTEPYSEVWYRSLNWLDTHLR